MLGCKDMDEHFAPTSGQVVAHAARSVALLHAVESTIAVATTNATILHSVALEASRLVESLEQYTGSTALDPEGRACELLEQASQTVGRLHQGCQRKLHAAQNAKELRSDDGVADAWHDMMDAAASCHNALQDARDRLLDLDALQSPRRAVYTNVDELFTDLGA